MNRKRRSGFTLVELLVVIAIIGVLMAMTIPAVQSSREMGRRAICQMHLGQIMLALQNYENAFEALPAGVINPDGPIRNEAVGLHQGWLIQMLPYLDEAVAYGMIDFSQSVYAPANAKVRALSPAVFLCPSDPKDVRGKSNFAGCHHDIEAPIAADNRGVLFLNSSIRRHDIFDGAAYTIFVGEKTIEPDDLGWMSGTRATLRNTGLTPNAVATIKGADRVVPPATDVESDDDESDESALLYVGGFGSSHVGGVFVGFGDSSVRYIADVIDVVLWHRLGNRADGKLVDIDFSDE
jgi:prepilin-type N-terminal cleavage/methylation domain-containing protein